MQPATRKAFAVLAAAFGGCMSNSRARLLQSRQLGLRVWELSVESLAYSGPKSLKASPRLEQGGQTEFVYNEATPFRQALGLSQTKLMFQRSPPILRAWLEFQGLWGIKVGGRRSPLRV